MAFWNKGKNNYELFKQLIELKLTDFQKGIKPNQKFRNASDTLINIFYKENIDIKKLKKLYNIYGSEIFLEYLNDVELKNKSCLRKSRVYANRRSCQKI